MGQVIWRAFCCSDTHGKVPPTYREDLCKAALHAGDFYDRTGAKIYGVAHWQAAAWLNAEQGMKEWAARGQAYFVKGNHDCGDPLKIVGDKDVTGKVVELLPPGPVGISGHSGERVGGRPGLWLVGLGWTGEKYYELPTDRCMSKVCADALSACAKAMRQGDHSIVLSHYCCPSFKDKHDMAGYAYEAIGDVVAALKPLAVVLGHQHGMFGKQLRDGDGTLYVYPGPCGGYLGVGDDWSASFDPAPLDPSFWGLEVTTPPPGGGGFPNDPGATRSETHPHAGAQGWLRRSLAQS